LTNLNELSRNTLQSYTKKATREYKKWGTKAKNAKTADDAFAHTRRQMRRTPGILLAKDKLRGDAKINATEETLQELSRTTLKSYVKKASKDQIAHQRAGNFGSDGNKKRHRDVARHRFYGIGLANRKLNGKAKIGANEETLQELSRKTLGSYIKKATPRSQMHAVEYSRARPKSDNEKYQLRKLRNKNIGIRRASDKLTKEETELQEDRVGQRVKIKPEGGMKEFHHKTGTIISKENGQYRVKLDDPVHIPGIGHVKDDLWDSKLLRKIKEETLSPFVDACVSAINNNVTFLNRKDK
jgi:hypothetical protein